MRHSLVRPVKIALHVFVVERIINSPLIHSLDAVIVVAERNVHTSVANVSRVKGVAHDVAVVYRLPDLNIAIDCH